MSSEKSTVDLDKSPFFPKGVYLQLPQFLRVICTPFSPGRSQDVALTASLGLLSGCLSNIKGRYRDETLFPDLYNVIAAPAGSGKGGLSLIRRLAVPLQNSFTENPDQSQQERETRHEEAAKNQKPDKLLIIPADISAAMFVEILQRNGDRGIIFETEVDTLTNTTKQDWGALDEKLRKAFHHEPITQARKGDKTTIIIDRPRLAMVMSGTVGQIIRLIQSPENGLFSRIGFYCYKGEFAWESVEPCYDCINPEQFFLQQGVELLEIIKHFEKYPAEFILSKDQWNKLNAFFTPLMKEYPVLHGEDAAGVVVRQGIQTFRFAMIISVFRAWETKSVNTTLQCSDQDFTTALELANVFTQHAMIMMKMLPQANNVNTVKGKDTLYPQLPLEFSRAEAVNIGNKAGEPLRNVDRWLSDWLKEGKLIQHKQGLYKKP